MEDPYKYKNGILTFSKLLWIQISFIGKAVSRTVVNHADKLVFKAHKKPDVSSC